MRKEIIIVTAAGIFFGLIIAFGIWRTNTALNVNNGTKQTETQNGGASYNTPSQDGELNITIASPKENDVIWNNPVNISGITRPYTTVLISGEDEDFVVIANEYGEFDQEINLSAGVNQVLISASDNSRNVSEKELTLVYSSEFAKQLDLD